MLGFFHLPKLRIFYDAVVGKDEQFTNLGQALSCAQDGWHILVLDNTQEQGNYTCGCNNLTIEGKSRNRSSLMFSDTVLTMTGDNITFKEIALNFALLGKLKTTGKNTTFENCLVDDASAANTYLLELTGAGNKICNMVYNQSANADRTYEAIRVSGERTSISNSYFNANNRNASFIYLGGAEGSVTGCQFKQTGGNNAVSVNAAGNYCAITGNTFEHNSGSSTGVQCTYYTTVAGNTFKNCSRAIMYISRCAITGNTFYLGDYMNGIYAVNQDCDHAVITGNSFIGTGGANCKAINLTSGNINKGLIIADNSFYSMGFGIGNSGCIGVSIKNNSFDTVTTPYNAPGAPQDIEPTVYTDAALEHHVRYFKNTSGGTLSAGQVVILKAVAASNEITTTTTAGDNKVWGIVTESIANNAWGHICTEGVYASAKVDGTTDIAIGDYLSCFTTAGILKKAAAGETAIAIANAAYTTDGSNGAISVRVIRPRII